MKRKFVLKKKRQIQPPSQHEYRSPEWITDMHEYYQQTGLYRARDLNRILGDPREQVVGTATDGFLVACGIPKK